MWLLGLGRHGLRGSRIHFRLQWRRTCLTVWWTSAPFLLLQSALILAPNPEKPEWENVPNEGREKNWTENVQQNKAINKAWKGSWQAKERLRKVKRENTTEAAVLFNISKSWKNLRWIPNGQHTHSTLEFLASKKSRPNPHTSESQYLGWDGTNSILLSHDLLPVGYPMAFFRPSRRGKRLQDISSNEHWHSGHS